MELKKVACTNCGGLLEINHEDIYGKCIFCGATYVVENAAKLAKIEIDFTKQLQNNRILLNEAIINEDIKMMNRYAGMIREIIPEDYFANYYYAYSSAKENNPNYLYHFYENKPLLCTKEEVIKITEHLISHSELRDYQSVIKYLENNQFINQEEYLNLFKLLFEKRKKQEEDYDEIPRDVFICYSSKNTKEALDVLNLLENDSNSCWISSRNLRPHDTINYWDNIERAIKLCKIFLVISSSDAMLSKDVKKEISIAKSLDKPRLEYKIDEASHTTFFKVFFDGCKWIYNDFIALRKRIYVMLEINHQPKINPVKSNLNNQEKVLEKEKKIIKKELPKVIYLKNDDYVASLEFIKFDEVKSASTKDLNSDRVKTENYLPTKLLLKVKPSLKLNYDVKIIVSSLSCIYSHEEKNELIKKIFSSKITNKEYLFHFNKNDDLIQDKQIMINTFILNQEDLKNANFLDFTKQQVEISMVGNQKIMFMQKMEKSENLIVLVDNLNNIN